MMKAVFIFSVFLLFSLSSCQQVPPAPTDVFFHPQRLDHFNFQNNIMFNQQVLVYNGSFSGDGPLFFYTGNEGDIGDFYNNTGFMFSLATKFHALIVFAEHRYYGKSLPFGAESFHGNNAGWLTSEQALADYAELIPKIKEKYNVRNNATIAFGGSYGGMLSAWFRMKYPNVITGALAASAPILQFEGLTGPEVFNRIVTEDFAMFDGCVEPLKQGMLDVNKMAATEEGLKNLTKAFSVCGEMKTANNVYNLNQFIYNALTYMAMINYPTPANFLVPLPAWPIKYTCAKVTAEKTPIAALAAAMNVYYNYTGTSTCYNMSGSGTSASTSLSDIGWNYQACTEMVMPMSADGINDMFPPQPWNLTTYIQQCQANNSVTPRPDWIKSYYNGVNFQATNIIFSNGKLDPWSGGGVLPGRLPNMKGIYPILIEDGAHHLDLRYPDPVNDPPSVTAARAQEESIIADWIKEANGPEPFDAGWMIAITVIMFVAAGFIVLCMLYAGNSKKHPADEEALLGGEN